MQGVHELGQEENGYLSLTFKRTVYHLLRRWLTKHTISGTFDSIAHKIHSHFHITL